MFTVEAIFALRNYKRNLIGYGHDLRYNDCSLNAPGSMPGVSLKYYISSHYPVPARQRRKPPGLHWDSQRTRQGLDHLGFGHVLLLARRRSELARQSFLG